MVNISSSSPLVFSGINPGSYCTISSFTGTFGTESIPFGSGIIVTTLSAGELKNDIIIRTVQQIKNGAVYISV